MSKWGKEEHQGDIKLNLDFVGPPGIKYPQRQPEMDCFDDVERLVRRVASGSCSRLWRVLRSGSRAVHLLLRHA